MSRSAKRLATPRSQPGPGQGELCLEAEGLVVESLVHRVNIVDEVTFAAASGEAIGIVGESGAGKTTVAIALLGYARRSTRIAQGSVRVSGVDVLELEDEELRRARGRRIAFVPQNPAKSLSPGMRIGKQLREVIDAWPESHDPRRSPLSVGEAFERAQLPASDEFLKRYPHQLSGGQQQRVAIAMALLCQPDAIVMDEPTTGLDVITQARLMEVIQSLCREGDTTIAYVSHDLGVVRNIAHRVVVMYGGRVVEIGTVADVFRRPRHPYTRRLLEAIPRVRGDYRPRGIRGAADQPWERPAGCPFVTRCDFADDACHARMPPVEMVDGGLVRCWNWQQLSLGDGRRPWAGAGEAAEPELAGPPPALDARQPGGGEMLEVEHLRAQYRTRTARRAGVFEAVSDVSFALSPGACLAIVGESGSGKTTLARCLAGLHEESAGTITLAGEQLGRPNQRSRELRRKIQLVFQDPDSSLNPSMRVDAIIERPLKYYFGLTGEAARRRCHELLTQVQLPLAVSRRYPAGLSGGEKQRVAIARAIAAAPSVIVCDEITSALDVAVQASILTLLQELRRSTGMSLIFISHDLAVVKAISDEIIVMKDGKLIEHAAAATFFRSPKDEYTIDLLDAVVELHDDDYPLNRTH